jgi:hypothetical protein
LNSRDHGRSGEAAWLCAGQMLDVLRIGGPAGPGETGHHQDQDGCPAKQQKFRAVHKLQNRLSRQFLSCCTGGWHRRTIWVRAAAAYPADFTRRNTKVFCDLDSGVLAY